MLTRRKFNFSFLALAASPSLNILDTLLNGIGESSSSSFHRELQDAAQLISSEKYRQLKSATLESAVASINGDLESLKIYYVSGWVLTETEICFLTMT
jgi:hypothetical protein